VRRMRGRGQSTVELAVGLPVLLFLALASLALLLAEHARTAVIDAARAGARLAAIECGDGVSGWQADAVAEAAQALRAGGLQLGPAAAPSPANPAGAWYVAASCGGGSATVTVYYNQPNPFPPLGGLLAAGTGAGRATFWLSASVVFPVE
jgi:Flp pilus assembly protein TadG